MKTKSLLLSTMAMLALCSTPSLAWADDEPYQPTESERALANQTIDNGNYRIYTEVDGTKYYLFTQSDRKVFLTPDKSSASKYSFELQTGLGKFADEAWRVSYADQFRFSNGSNSASDGQKNLSMAESKNDRPDFERQVWYAKEDAQNSGEYVYAVRATNATCADELVWQSWSKNCYWTVNTTDALPYPCYDVANAGKGSFVWKLETTKEEYKPIHVYSLNDLTAEEFAQNPAIDGLWRFEKYNYSNGKYSLFTQYTDSSAANYVDIYQPCRVGGERAVEIEGLESWANNLTYATVLKYGWSDFKTYSEGEGASNDSKNRFAYVARDEKLGYEVYANNEYASVISFVVPKDGFYQMDATVIRQDVPADRGLLSIVPRYRYNTAVDKDYANTKYGMGRYLFGQIGGEVDGFVAGSAHISKGGLQRYIAQEANDISMSFEGKAGDIISFEVNTDSTGVISSWARDYYGRTFYKQLRISEVTETFARQNENFADTYGESGDIEAILKLIEESEAFIMDADLGTEIGQYSEELAEEIMQLTGVIYDAIQKGQIHAFNAQSYLEELKALWAKFLDSKVEMDYNAEDNYALFTTEASTGAVRYDTAVLDLNDDTPWGYYYYEVAKGVYHKFENHGTGSKFGSAEISAWYKGTGDWLYISDNGQLHPMTNFAPAIMFTAPKDGVYKVNFGCYRPNPNASVENPLWIRARFLSNGTETQDKESFMYAKEFGSVQNDGEGGKAPIAMEYYVNMKEGDKITWELDCYTSNRNSSAGTQITNLTVCAGMNEEEPFTLDNIPADADLFDAYSEGDPTSLSLAVAAAHSVLDAHKDSLGTDGGQYSADIFNSLTESIATANTMIASGDTQYNMDQMELSLAALTQLFLDSRLPYEVFIEGTYAIQIVGTEKFLTQKNLNANGTNFYAAFADIAAVEADAQKNNIEPDTYNWTFNFNKYIKQVPTGEFDESTGDEITVPVEQTSIYGVGGYVTEQGYVNESVSTTAAPAFRFFKYNADDEAFAIMNQSGNYWSNAFTWKSPYDQINTTATPNYIFVLSDQTISNALGIDIVESTVVVSTQWLSLSGTRIAKPNNGINIRVQKLSDGRTVTSKVFVKK